MGFFKALKQDLSAKLGVVKEEAKASDLYQDTKKASEAITQAASPFTTLAKEAGKSALNSAREVKAGVFRSLAKEFSSSMPALSKELRDKARATNRAINKSEKES